VEVALDLAVDFGKHDLRLAPNNDLDVVTGQATVDQRIRVRLFIPQGEWLLDPTDGSLGSHLRDAFRMTPSQGIDAAKLLVREALEPMTDISVTDVDVTQNPDNPRAIDILIYYQMSDVGAGESEVLTTQVTVG
jgi:hypothetical protein